MDEQVLIEKVIKEVLASMGGKAPVATEAPEAPSNCGCSYQGNRITFEDYPLASKRPDLVKTPTNKKLSDINLKKVLSGEVTPHDVRISSETLEMQAQIAESVGRGAFARNLRRAAELIAVPDERILEIYNALRPYRSTKQELLEIADELEKKYNAKINSAFIREAAEVYELRNRLRID